MKKISKIIIKQEIDGNRDLDYLGIFSDSKGKYPIDNGKGKYPIDNGKGKYPIDNGKGKYGIAHYQVYFNANNVVNMKQAEENYKRVMQFAKGEIPMLCIKAVAELNTSLNGKEWLINHLSSGGLYGVEGDIPKEDLEDIGKEQLDYLKEVLREVGFSEEEINEVEVQREEAV